jgi:phosphoglycerate dehydrogenase-like enzyme
MTKVLVYLKEPERSAMRFERLAEDDGGVSVHVASSLGELDDRAREANVLISIGPHLGGDAADLYRQLPKLEWAQSIGTGVDNIKGHPDLPRGVTVTNVRGVHGAQISEAALAAMLIFSRQIRAQLAHQANAEWRKMPVELLNGKTVTILGIGAIARALAPRCRALGMRVTGVSSQPRDEENFDRIFGRPQLTDALAEADYIVVLTPYSAQTHHMLDAEAFLHTKPGAYLVNLARGGVVDEAALLYALDRGQLAGAAMDVFVTEPLPATSPFWVHPKVVVTPHSGGFHAGYPDQAYAFIARNMRAYRSGGVAALENKV